MQHQRLVNLGCKDKTCNGCKLLDEGRYDGIVLYFCTDTCHQLITDTNGEPKRTRSCRAGEAKAREATQ